MTEEISWQAMYEQVVAENEALKEKIAKMKIAYLPGIETAINVFKIAIHNSYFWIGYFVAIIVMWIMDKVFSKGV